MARFFIDRPIFAWVIALFILVFGGVAIKVLPVAQYPSVAPPSLVISAIYPGASAHTLDEAVISVIEQQLNGSPGLAYMESVSQANGTAAITVTFEAGTNIDLAQVDIQNRLSRAAPRLPAAVVQQGVNVDKSRSNFLLFITLSSKNGSMTPIELGDYASRNILPEIQRLPGIGQAQLFGTERAMRIWLDPAKLIGYKLSTAEVNAAISKQNALVPAGVIGDLPNPSDQTTSATLVVHGQLENAEQFGNIVLRANADGSTVRLKDVARIELGGQGYGSYSRLNGQPSTGIGVQLSPTGNALAAATAVKARMEELKKYFPPGVIYEAPYDSSKFVKISIQQVVETLIEAVILVFLVMFLFLQDWRYTLIPTLVVPVALLGAFAAMLALGYSINVLTLFGLVLAVGMLVDDAIVVVENVERIMSEEGLGPREATRKAMGQISSAIIGITVVMLSVFVPMAFFSGTVGNIYRQFAMSMMASMMVSAFMALSLTPALCATLLKKVEAGHHHEKKGFFGWFNRGFTRTTKTYEGWVAKLLKRSGRMLIAYGAVVLVVGFVYAKLPTSFLPNEDQGYLIVNVQLPPGATTNRTEAAVKAVEDFMHKQPEVADTIGVIGFSFSGQGQNAALVFVPLKPWEERHGKDHSASALAGRAFGALMGVRDAFIYPLSPPPIPELGTATGFALRVQDRAGLGHDALLGARNQLLGMAMQSKVITGMRPDGLEDAPQLQVDIDRDKANALGVGFDTIANVLGTQIGSAYINDFPNQGRLQRVIVQAEAGSRMQPADVLKLNVPNAQGAPVPLSSFASTRWVTGQMQATRYNGYPAMRLAGDTVKGRSSGEALAEIEALCTKLPAGIGCEWTGLSREEKISGAQATILLAFSLLAVFLSLSALYESWSIPFAVLLVVPLGLLGSVLGTWVFGFFGQMLGNGWAGLANDVYFKIGLITIMGLSAKNAILIIEFAKDLQAQGKELTAAILEAAHLRFRPILMTSMAFILGVTPLFLASGAGSASQRAVGTGVLCGMITATALAVLFVPVFFLVVRRFFKGSERQRMLDAHELDKPAAPDLHKGAGESV